MQRRAAQRPPAWAALLRLDGVLRRRPPRGGRRRPPAAVRLRARGVPGAWRCGGQPPMAAQPSEPAGALWVHSQFSNHVTHCRLPAPSSHCPARQTLQGPATEAPDLWPVSRLFCACRRRYAVRARAAHDHEPLHDEVLGHARGPAVPDLPGHAARVRRAGALRAQLLRRLPVQPLCCAAGGAASLLVPSRGVPLRPRVWVLLCLVVQRWEQQPGRDYRAAFPG